MEDIIIVGAGGFGREVALLAAQHFNVVGFVDDFKTNVKNNLVVLGNTDFLAQYTHPINVCIAIADSSIKMSIYKKLMNNNNLKFPNIIANSAIIKDRVILGFGNIVCDNVVISCDSVIGNFVAVDVSCSIGHDVIIDDYCTFYPLVSISGNVHVNSNSQMGTNSTVIQGLSIGCNSFIGAGACVIDNIPDNVIAVGVPCKVIKNR